MDGLFLTARSSPHIRTKLSTRSIMTDVSIALVPLVLVGVYQFGWYALAVLVMSVGGAVLTEYLFTKLLKKKLTITDGSAVVTGLLLGLSLPAGVPLWLPLIGSVFAILVVKCLFGGIGQNFVNPALAARAMLVASWPALMTTFSPSREMQDSWIPWLAKQAQSIGFHVADVASGGTADASSVATPLASVDGVLASWPANSTEFLAKFFGYATGVIGEVSVLAILLAATYLFVRKVIRPLMPLVFLGSFSFFAWLWLGNGGLFTGNVLAELMFGGVLFVAFFMVTDYSTSPMTKAGQIIFAAAAGFLTVVIRAFGSYPEGVTYAVLMMNLCVPLIDRLIVPRAFGVKKVKHD